MWWQHILNYQPFGIDFGIRIIHIILIAIVCIVLYKMGYDWNKDIHAGKTGK